MWPVEFGPRRVAVELLWLLICIAGLMCKALSLGNGQFTGETLPVLSQKIKKNLGISNPRFKFETQLCYSGLSVESLLCYVSKKF